MKKLAKWLLFISLVNFVLIGLISMFIDIIYWPESAVTVWLDLWFVISIALLGLFVPIAAVGWFKEIVQLINEGLF